MEAFLAIASKRDVRDFAPEPIEQDALWKILEAGRITGSGFNRQPWRFAVVRDKDALAAVAKTLTRPTNLDDAAAAVVLILTEDTDLTRFDAGRCAQNMMIAGWDLKIGSLPNRVKDADAFRAVVPTAPDEVVVAVIALGVPADRRDPRRRSSEEWLRRADRRPLQDSVDFV